tara:strand:+ start:141 stop:938 length:798 start_codon:yes stop_codon:yes gene_type:complete
MDPTGTPNSPEMVTKIAASPKSVHKRTRESDEAEVSSKRVCIDLTVDSDDEVDEVEVVANEVEVIATEVKTPRVAPLMDPPRVPTDFVRRPVKDILADLKEAEDEMIFEFITEGYADFNDDGSYTATPDMPASERMSFKACLARIEKFQRELSFAMDLRSDGVMEWVEGTEAEYDEAEYDKSGFFYYVCVEDNEVQMQGWWRFFRQMTPEEEQHYKCYFRHYFWYGRAVYLHEDCEMSEMELAFENGTFAIFTPDEYKEHQWMIN